VVEECCFSPYLRPLAFTWTGKYRGGVQCRGQVSWCRVWPSECTSHIDCSTGQFGPPLKGVCHFRPTLFRPPIYQPPLSTLRGAVTPRN
jgi:hypothetical protein